MKRIVIFCAALTAAMWVASASGAASTSVGVNVSRGQSDTMAYSLNIAQRYEPWIASDICSLAPIAELGGHAWVPDDDDHDNDTVWGGYFAPGLRFTMNTDKQVRPYLEASVGGALNSDDEIDDRDLGSNLLFRTRGSVGLNFGDDYRHRIQGDYIHYSTWGITNTNDGYNTYGLSYGYSF